MIQYLKICIVYTVKYRISTTVAIYDCYIIVGDPFKLSTVVS